jgi:serine/threonine protein kinase
LREVVMLSKLDHPNIVKVQDAFQDDVSLLIVMEMCVGGPLITHLRPINFHEDSLRAIASKILGAISHCHVNGIVHRDIKLDNIVYAHLEDDSELKLIDFGFACFFGKTMGRRLGTMSYMAPELLNGERDPLYGFEVDMWSFGVTMFYLMTGKRPFHDSDEQIKMQKIQAGAPVYNPKIWSRFSADAKDFVQKLLCRNPYTRLTAHQALKHPWIVASSSRKSLDEQHRLRRATSSMRYKNIPQITN